MKTEEWGRTRSGRRPRKSYQDLLKILEILNLTQNLEEFGYNLRTMEGPSLLGPRF